MDTSEMTDKQREANERAIAEVRQIAARLKAFRDKLPENSGGLGGFAFQVEQICGEIESGIRAGSIASSPSSEDRNPTNA